MGIKFVSDSTIYSQFLWRIMQADWVSNTYITDTAGWQKLSGTYTAKGGEKWMIIGNFYPHRFFPMKIVGDTINDGIVSYIYVDGCSLEQIPLQIPNVFTPNGDGVNDAFIVKGLPENSKICIYNRWGTVVYKSDNYKNDWQGNSDGLPCSEGVYYYLLTTPTKNYKGFITLLR